MVVKASVVGVRWEESRITTTGKNKVLAKERRKGKSFHGAHGTGGSDVFIYGTRNGKWQKFTKVCESFGARFRLRSLWRMQNSVALRLSHTAVFYNFDMINPIRTITMFSLFLSPLNTVAYLPLAFLLHCRSGTIDRHKVRDTSSAAALLRYWFSLHFLLLLNGHYALWY